MRREPPPKRMLCFNTYLREGRCQNSDSGERIRKLGQGDFSTPLEMTVKRRKLGQGVRQSLGHGKSMQKSASLPFEKNAYLRKNFKYGIDNMDGPAYNVIKVRSIWKLKEIIICKNS